MSTNDSPISPVAVSYNQFGQPIGYSTDAFSRLRVSSPQNLLDSKQTFSSGSPLYMTSFTASGGAVSYNASRASSFLSCTTTPGSRAVRQTKRYLNYQPGKSQLVFVTFVMETGAQAGVTKSVGYFDDNNGIFFQAAGTTLQMVVRSNVSGGPVNTAVPQANWNLDTLDGTGSSGFTLDVSKAQILVIDFEWLGVGVVRTGFVIDGAIVYVHAFYHSNVITSVYMQSPNLPVRWEILGAGTAGGLESICCSIASEGGAETVGATRSANRGVTAKSLTSANEEQVISVRLQSGFIRAPAQLIGLDFVNTSNANVLWELILNPTIGGAAVWQAVPSSFVEYDVNLTAAGTRVYTPGSGFVLASGYLSGVARSEQAAIGELAHFASDFAGNPDVFALCLRSDANTTILASLTWLESA